MKKKLGSSINNVKKKKSIDNNTLENINSLNQKVGSNHFEEAFSQFKKNEDKTEYLNQMAQINLQYHKSQKQVYKRSISPMPKVQKT